MIYNEFGTITFNNSNVIFTGNSAGIEGSGGALWNNPFVAVNPALSSIIEFNNSNIAFTNNTANFDGGAISICSDVSGTLPLSITTTFYNSDVSFTSNTANYYGGAISVWSYRGALIKPIILTFSNGNVTFTGNSSIDGGAIYNAKSISFSNVDTKFEYNMATSSGGAIFNNSATVVFSNSSVAFTGNTSVYGGAVYDNASTMTFTDSNVVFSGNNASLYGGAIYLIGNSRIDFNVSTNTTTTITFKDNSANGVLNDIFFNDSTSTVTLNATTYGIVLDNGIRVTGTGTINKTGTGSLTFGGYSEIWSNFNISGGDVILLANAKLKGTNLQLPSGSSLDMQNGTVNAIDVEYFTSLKETKIDIFANGNNDKVTAGYVTISGNLDVKAMVGNYNGKEYDIIVSTSSNVGGRFTSVSGTSLLTYTLNYTDDPTIVKLIVDGVYVSTFSQLSALTYNQKQVAKTFDALSIKETTSNSMADFITTLTEENDVDQRTALAQVSGYFLANVIRNLAADSPNNEVYDKIRNHREEYDTNNELWVQMKGGIESFNKDENSLENYKDTSIGVLFGFDRYIIENPGEDLMWGVYGRINKDNAEQGNNKANGNKNGLGMYGGYIRNEWELKAMFLGSYDIFSTERAVMGQTAKADINAVTINADIEGALKYEVVTDVVFRPYAGIELENSMYGGFKESEAGIFNLDVTSSNYLRTAGRLGAGLNYEKEIWSGYVNVEGKYIISGTEPEIEAAFQGTDVSFNSRGSEEGSIQFSLGFGGEVRIAQNWKMFANAKYYAGERYENLYGNIGVRYMLDINKNKEKKHLNKEKINLKEAKNKFNAAKKLYERGEYLRATDMLSEILTSYPNFVYAKNLYKKIKDGMTETAASREEADFGKLTYAKGYCAYYAVEYNDALKEWAKYVQFTGGSDEIKEYIEKVNNQELIKRESELDATAMEMLNSGIVKYNASKWVLCIKDMEALQKFVNDNKFSKTAEYYNEAKKYIEMSVSELAKTIKTGNKPKKQEAVPSDEKKQEINEAGAEQKYNEGLVLYAQGKYLEAERAWEFTLRLNPNHQKAKVALTKLRSSGYLTE